MSNSRGCVPLGTHKVLWCLSTNPIFAATPRNVQGETVTTILQIKKPGLSRTGSKVQKGDLGFLTPPRSFSIHYAGLMHTAGREPASQARG